MSALKNGQERATKVGSVAQPKKKEVPYSMDHFEADIREYNSIARQTKVLEQKQEELSKRIRDYSDTHRHELFGENKTYYGATGTLTYAQNPPSIEFESGVKEEDVIRSMEADICFKAFLKKSIDKMAVEEYLKAPLNAKALKSIGILGVKRVERLGIKP